ncbi:sensor histidine kinase [Sphingosinithalassobacter portus]|uniref:sensor histidine kinase n=1 Tax=Stakelama portus TaxID=2676234 RepID=UPI000D6DCD5F|nr:ATP-binding protein [Sphingosinithalassobacter portus]
MPVRPESKTLFRRSALAAVLLLFVILAGWLAGALASGIAEDTARARIGTEARLRAALLDSEVARFRLLPFLLANDTDVHQALRMGASARRALDAKFARLAHDTGAGAIYLLDPDGLTISASNAGTPMSFVGKNYAFRAYYREAKGTGSGLDYAVGNVSGRPGMFLSQRTPSGGVVVVKLEFANIETEWARGGGVTLVEDPEGTVLVTSDPRLRFRDDEGTNDAVLLASLLPEQQIAATVPTDIENWRLVHSEPRANALGAVVPIARSAGALAALSFLALGWIVVARRRRRLEKERFRIARTAELEAVVEERTSELLREMEERSASEERAAELREGLRQANRLATLGQVTAGLAHETAQPVAAIRTYASSGMTLSERGDVDGAKENFAAIARLADRIGRITVELRNFSRKRTGQLTDVPLDDAISGAQLILKQKLRPIALDISPDIRGVLVRAGRVRLEQILVNLLQNAVEALADTDRPRIAISFARTDDSVLLTIADNGPGLSRSMAEKLFTPFASEREGGLGLGLVIARDIARDMGGDLTHHVANSGGAAFELMLKAGGSST